MYQIQTFHVPCYLLTQDQLMTHFYPIYYLILLAIRNWTWKNNSGVSWTWGPDPIVFFKSKKKTSLAWHKSVSPPQNLLSHTHTKSCSVLRNNLPSQPSCDDVSFLITNCLFMLQQLPRAANKWLKECLDQAFRPLLSGGCYLVDSDGSSCLVWKRAAMGRQWLTEGPLGQPRWPHVFLFLAPKEKAGPCLRLEVKGNVGG